MCATVEAWLWSSFNFPVRADVPVGTNTKEGPPGNADVPVGTAEPERRAGRNEGLNLTAPSVSRLGGVQIFTDWIVCSHGHTIADVIVGRVNNGPIRGADEDVGVPRSKCLTM